MDCATYRRLVSDLDDPRADRQDAELDAHLTECRECSDWLDFQTAIQESAILPWLTGKGPHFFN